MKKIILMIVMIVINISLCWSDEIGKTISKLQKKETRQEAVKEIEKIGKPAVTQLRQLAKDKKKDQNSRISAIVLLGRMNAEESGADLEKILEKDEDKLCREASAISLGNLGNKKAIPKLKQALKDESGNVRMRAVQSLAKLGDKSGKQLALDTLTKENDVTGKILAGDALEAIGDKNLIPILRQYDNDNNVWTRVYTNLAIKKLEMVGLSGSEQMQYLKKALNDSQNVVNQWSVLKLAEIGTNEAINILKEAAKNKEIKGSRIAKGVLIKLVEIGKISENEIK